MTPACTEGGVLSQSLCRIGKPDGKSIITVYISISGISTADPHKRPDSLTLVKRLFDRTERIRYLWVKSNYFHSSLSV
jgi:hypothetical protein